MATLGTETVHPIYEAQAETSQHKSRFGLHSPWEQYYHPIDTFAQGRFECELDEVVVFGEIPKEISGTWYRILVDPHFVPYENVPFVDGDGHICAFRIQDGKISMKMKYVHTEKWLLERQAGRRLFGNYRNPFDNHPCVRYANDSTANTNIIYWGGDILALAERGLPYSIDPDTLETRGPDPYGGQVAAKTFAAHPKVDPHKNELVTWSYAAKGLGTLDICTYSIDPTGRIHNEAWFKQDLYGWPHDGWITDNWIVLSNMPFGVNSDEIMQAGGDYWKFMPDQPSEFLVMPRYANNPALPGWKAGEMRKYTAPHGLIIHTGNGWEEEDGILKLESHFLNINIFHFWNPEGYKGPPGGPNGGWDRWTIDLSKPSGTALPPAERLMEGILDFPIFDERMTARKTKIIYTGGMAAPKGSNTPRFNSIIKLNTETGERATFYADIDGSVSEPAYIPRGPDCEEGDGWLIFYTKRDSCPKGELVILDCNDFSKPIAIAVLPFPTKNQVHGNWVPNPHPWKPLPLLSGPIKDITSSTKYSQLNRIS